MTDFANAIVDGGETLLWHLKIYLGIDPTDTTDDESLSRSINLAGDMCETYIDSTIVLREVSENFAFHFGTVTLHNVPAGNLVTVLVNGIEATDYSWYLHNTSAKLTRIGHPRDVPMDWRNFDQVVVTYAAGYDPIPSDLAQAIVYTSGDLSSSEGSGSAPGGSSGDMKSLQIYDVGAVTYDVGSSSSGGGSNPWESNTGALNSVTVGILSRYKRISA